MTKEEKVLAKEKVVEEEKAKEVCMQSTDGPQRADRTIQGPHTV